MACLEVVVCEVLSNHHHLDSDEAFPLNCLWLLLDSGDQLYQVPPVLGKGNTSRHFLVLEQHWHLFEKYELINCNKRSPIKNRVKSTSKRSDKRSAIKNRVKSTPKKNQVLDGC